MKLTFLVNPKGKRFLIIICKFIIFSVVFFAGIDMVKISDVEAEAKYNIINTPSLVYFRKRVPLIYDGKHASLFFNKYPGRHLVQFLVDRLFPKKGYCVHASANFSNSSKTWFISGDLFDEDKILAWLTSQDVFEIKNEIEEVNRKMLAKLLDENEFLAVYFCE